MEGSIVLSLAPMPPGAVGPDRTKKGSHPGVITLKQQRVLVEAEAPESALNPQPPQCLRELR